MSAAFSSSHTPRPSPPRRTSASDDDPDSDNESSSCRSSIDEEAVNTRVSPNWYSYRCTIASRGFRLDTCKDVKEWYHQYWATQASEGRTVSKDLPGYLRACRVQDEDELCRDAGLVSGLHVELLRGTQIRWGLTGLLV